MIRTYISTDCRHLAELFYQTVHFVNASDYSENQLNAWASGNVNLEEWNRSFLEHITLAAVDDGILTGFGDMDYKGYLDRLYVHKDYQKRGIATALCDELELAVHAKKFTTHASITAKPFFEKRGYWVVTAQQVERNGVLLTNYVMEKH